MRSLADPLPVRLAQSWVALYTRGLPSDLRDARRAEIASDLWEHRNHGSPNESGGMASGIVGRVVAGVPADISWRVEEQRFARKGGAVSTSWFGRRMPLHRVVPGFAVLAGLVTIAGMSSSVAATVAALTFFAVAGLLRGLVVSPVAISSGMGAHMETSIDHRRRTTLLIVLAVSAIVLAGTYAYAMSLEHWGDTRAIIFISVGWVSLAVGLVALALIVADFARARRS